MPTRFTQTMNRTLFFTKRVKQIWFMADCPKETTKNIFFTNEQFLDTTNCVLPRIEQNKIT
jgi:hypothetical protein